jgi:translation initiation factor IF-1
MAKSKKNTITNGVVIGPYANGCVLVSVNNGAEKIICYDDNRKPDDVSTLKPNDKVEIEISALDPNRGWILKKL